MSGTDGARLKAAELSARNAGAIAVSPSVIGTARGVSRVGADGFTDTVGSDNDAGDERSCAAIRWYTKNTPATTAAPPLTISQRPSRRVGSRSRALSPGPSGRMIGRSGRRAHSSSMEAQCSHTCALAADLPHDEHLASGKACMARLGQRNAIMPGSPRIPTCRTERRVAMSRDVPGQAVKCLAFTSPTSAPARWIYRSGFVVGMPEYVTTLSQRGPATAGSSPPIRAAPFRARCCPRHRPPR